MTGERPGAPLHPLLRQPCIIRPLIEEVFASLVVPLLEKAADIDVWVVCGQIKTAN